MLTRQARPSNGSGPQGEDSCELTLGERSARRVGLPRNGAATLLRVGPKFPDPEPSTLICSRGGSRLKGQQGTCVLRRKLQSRLVVVDRLVNGANWSLAERGYRC